MEPAPIDVMNKIILLSIFLAGMLIGAVITLIISELTKPKRDE